ncbi:MAG: hypothetical protein U1E73_08710 [Planctomycetota bacterium]
MKMQVQKISPVLAVDAIEPALPFWVDRLGFTATVQVPLAGDGGPLGFVILVKDGLEVMLQTRASIRGDVAALADEPNRAFLFVEVDAIAAIEAAVAGCEIAVPRRRTFYGAEELGVRAPGGHVVLFAEMRG